MAKKPKVSTRQPPPKTAVGYVAIAKHFGVSPSTVGFWKSMGAPIVPRQPVKLSAVETWYRRYLAPQKSKAMDELYELRKHKLKTAIAKEMHGAKKEAALAALAEMEVEQKRKHLIAAAESLQLLQSMCTAIKHDVVTLSKKYAHRLVGLDSIEKVRAVLDQFSSDLLETMSRAMQKEEQAT